jgi:hypothetical protein
MCHNPTSIIPSLPFFLPHLPLPSIAVYHTPPYYHYASCHHPPYTRCCLACLQHRFQGNDMFRCVCASLVASKL